jgi:hypothetical protein
MKEARGKELLDFFCCLPTTLVPSVYFGNKGIKHFVGLLRLFEEWFKNLLGDVMQVSCNFDLSLKFKKGAGRHLQKPL